MNRTNDIHFFELWDLAQEIKAMYDTHLSPKAKLEVIELEEELYEQAGFYADYSYQEAIKAYTDSREYIYVS